MGVSLERTAPARAAGDGVYRSEIGPRSVAARFRGSALRAPRHARRGRGVRCRTWWTSASWARFEA